MNLGTLLGLYHLAGAVPAPPTERQVDTTGKWARMPYRELKRRRAPASDLQQRILRAVRAADPAAGIFLAQVARAVGCDIYDAAPRLQHLFLRGYIERTLERPLRYRGLQSVIGAHGSPFDPLRASR